MQRRLKIEQSCQKFSILQHILFINVLIICKQIEVTSFKNSMYQIYQKVDLPFYLHYLKPCVCFGRGRGHTQGTSDNLNKNQGPLFDKSGTIFFKDH